MLMIESISVMETISISWSAPYNGGESIDLYEVELLTLENTFTIDDQCTGEIANGLNCLFGHEYLMTEYSFPVGHIPQFRVRAHNKYGWGGFSQVNIGSAFIQTIP